jgi:serine/threonine protein kinase
VNCIRPISVSVYLNYLAQNIRTMCVVSGSSQDIKPENLLISSEDVLKLCDFGEPCQFLTQGRVGFLHTHCMHIVLYLQGIKYVQNTLYTHCVYIVLYLQGIKYVQNTLYTHCGYIVLYLQGIMYVQNTLYTHCV